MKKLGKRLLITGYIGMAVGVVTLVLMVRNWVQNGVTTDDTQVIRALQLILIGVGCYFLGLGQAEEIVKQEANNDKIRCR